jgi:acyl-ACP thioesterase
MRGPAGLLVEAVALWVFIDRENGRPLPLDDNFHRIYAEAAAGRRVSGRLGHRRPPPGIATRPWALRESDFDVLDHVNNARYLEAVEDELAARLPGRRPVRASVEYRGAVERGDAVELASDVIDAGDDHRELAVWLVAGGEVRMSGLVTTVEAPEAPRFGGAVRVS